MNIWYWLAKDNFFTFVFLIILATPLFAQADTISSFGMNTGLANRYPEEEAKAADMLFQAGILWSREEFTWKFIEPNKIENTNDRKFIFDTSGSSKYSYDRAIQAAMDHNLQVLGLLTYGPSWSDNNTQFDTILPYWREFVRQVVSRYKEIYYWQIQNEPNIIEFWKNVDKTATQPNAVDYVKLLKAAYEVIHEINPQAQVVLGGLATGDSGKDNHVDYYEYLAQIHDASGWPYFDILAVHPYRAPYRPEDAISCSYYDVKKNQRVGSPKKYRLVDALNAFETLMAPWGMKPIWLTEIGWATESLKARAKERRTTEEIVQADYLIRSFVQMASLPLVQNIMWYNFRNDITQNDTENSYGIIARNFMPKPAYYSYSTMSSLLTDSQFIEQKQGKDYYGRNGDDDVHEYRFKRGDQTVTALWKAQGGDEVRQVIVDDIPVNTVLLYGPDFTSLNPPAKQLPVTKEQATLSLTERPIFLVWQDRALSCKNIRSNKPKPLATAIVFDHSGSMADERKIDYAREATFAFTPHMKEEDLLSVSIFSNDAKTPAGLELKKRTDILPSLRSILPTIAPNGQTNIGAGLESGLEQLCTVSGENVKKGALLLSDGMNNVGSYDVVVQDYKKWQIPIYTVRFGNQASEDNLRKIAENTGGVYMDSNQETVTGIYSRMYHHINGDSTITASHDPMSPTGKLAYHVDVSSGADSLHVNTSWQGSRLKTIFTSPSGSTFSGNHLPGPTDRFEEGSISQYTQILNPESGLWKLDISWDEPPAETERVNLLVSEHTDVYTSILGFSPEYSAGEQVTINAHAAELDGGNNKIPLKNARVKAKVQIPGHEVIRMIQAQSGNLRVYNDVVQDNTREVELFDDGAHNDYKAGDGIFGGFFTETQRNGSYIVSAYIEGNRKNGGHVSRRSTGTFQVGSLLNAEVTTSEIMQYARQLEERMKAKVANPLGGMQSPASPHPTSSDTPSGSRKNRSRSLMDSLSN